MKALNLPNESDDIECQNKKNEGTFAQLSKSYKIGKMQ